MGLLENLAGQVLGGGQGGAAGGDLLSHVIGLINNQPGGLGGLVEQFQQKGLGDVVSSWVGTGANQPISADQVQSVLGGGVVSDIAGKLGLPADAVSGQLSELLPGVINHLTPNGEVPQGLESVGLDLLKGFFNR